MRPALAAAAGIAALLAGACGGSAGDLLALEVSGRLQEESLRLTVTGDGRARCGGGALEPISSELLIEARELERDLEGLAEEGARYLGGPAKGRRYVARTRAGTVRWREGAPGLPEVLPRAALLAEQLDDEVCG